MKFQKTYRTFCIYLLLVACVCALPVDITLAASAGEDDSVRDATVNLYCNFKAGRKIYSTSGSGVFVSDRGVILTNAHVALFFLLAQENIEEKTGKKAKVRGACSVRTGSPAKASYDASVLYLSPLWIEDNASELLKKTPKGTGEGDFALLYVTDAKKGAVPERFPSLAIDTTGAIAEKETVTIAGYPTEKLDFKGVQRKLKAVTAPSAVTNVRTFTKNNQSLDVLTLAPSAAGSFGVSGGPVIDDSGEVIGIVTTKSAAKDDRTLRSITLGYIDRTLESETTLPLNALLSGDFALQASSTSAAITPAILKIVTNSLLKKR